MRNVQSVVNYRIRASQQVLVENMIIQSLSCEHALVNKNTGQDTVLKATILTNTSDLNNDD